MFNQQRNYSGNLCGTFTNCRRAPHDSPNLSQTLDHATTTTSPSHTLTTTTTQHSQQPLLCGCVTTCAQVRFSFENTACKRRTTTPAFLIIISPDSSCVHLARGCYRGLGTAKAASRGTISSNQKISAFYFSMFHLCTSIFNL